MAALSDPNDITATSLEDKAEMVEKVVFFHQPANPIGPPPHPEGTAHQRIDEDKVRRAQFDQSQKKVPGSDRLNFSTLRLLWKWDTRRITVIIHRSIPSGNHPRAWKRAKRFMLRKKNMLDYTTVKSYSVISLLSCLDKICQKVMTDILSQWCEVYKRLPR